jgi:hypothetical protein
MYRPTETDPSVDTKKTKKRKNEKCNHFQKKAILRHQFFFVDAAAVTVC